MGGNDCHLVQTILWQTRVGMLLWSRLDEDTHVCGTEKLQAYVYLFQKDVRGPSSIVLQVQNEHGRFVIREPEWHFSETFLGFFAYLFSKNWNTIMPDFFHIQMPSRPEEKELAEKERLRKLLRDLYAFVTTNYPVILT